MNFLADESCAAPVAPLDFELPRLQQQEAAVASKSLALSISASGCSASSSRTPPDRNVALQGPESGPVRPRYEPAVLS